MNALLSLWLPILLSAVVVFVISSLIHMVIKWHAPDYRGFSNEDAVRDAIRAGNPTPGKYVVPYCSDMKEMGGEKMLAKYREGPVGLMMIGPNGPPNMGKLLGMWFLFSLLIAVAGAFIATQLFGLDPTRARAAAKLVGAVSFLAYGFGTITETIWGMRSVSSSAKYLLDAALYSVASGFVFYWLWP
jgi:hypothetical protein